MGYGAGHATAPPFLVVTHSAPEKVRLDLDFTFVTDGLHRRSTRRISPTATHLTYALHI